MRTGYKIIQRFRLFQAILHGAICFPYRIVIGRFIQPPIDVVVLVIDRFFQHISKCQKILVFCTEYKVAIANQVECFAELFVDGLLLLNQIE